VAVSSQDDGNGQQARSSVEVQREHEAVIMAARIQELVDGKAGAIVYDNESQQWRIPNYGDFALLFRASSGFDFFEQAFRAAGIPYLTTAGRGYYGRKEVQDLINMLYVLNDPMDDLALVGVLRSPLFALDDATIMRLRIANPHSIWDALMHNTTSTDTETSPADTATDASTATDTSPVDTATDTSPADLHEHDSIGFARATLQELHRIRGQVSVVELLRAILDKTGYMATISGLPDGSRRRVNVEKLLEAARRSVHAGLSDYSTYLEQLLKAEPREGEAPLEAEGVVRLMTVHRSKGLEFPIVVLPDMARKSPPRREKWLAHRGSGIALRLRGETGDWEKPLAFHLAEYEEARMERAEHERLLYVALTRARDYLMMSGPAPNSGKDGNDWLSRLIHTQGWTWAKGGPPPGTHGALQVFWHIVGGENGNGNGNSSRERSDTGNGNETG
jgi:ATP-dependent helicase/nuclease subunit A